MSPVGADPLAVATTPVPLTVLEQPARSASAIRRAVTSIPLWRRIGTGRRRLTIARSCHRRPTAPAGRGGGAPQPTMGRGGSAGERVPIQPLRHQPDVIDQSPVRPGQQVPATGLQQSLMGHEAVDQGPVERAATRALAVVLHQCPTRSSSSRRSARNAATSRSTGPATALSPSISVNAADCTSPDDADRGPRAEQVSGGEVVVDELPGRPASSMTRVNVRYLPIRRDHPAHPALDPRTGSPPVTELPTSLSGWQGTI